MKALLAIVPRSDECHQPDAAWIKKHVSIFEVAKSLGLRIHHRRARCWRIGNHRHGDADPSLHFLERKNRVRCFVCDMRGGHSNIDLAMGVLGIPFGDAVRWIAERFTVPNVKPGRPVGSHAAQAAPYRVGVHGSEFEVLVRSGMFGQLPAPERSVLVMLAHLRDPDSGLTRLSYAGIMRYAGVSSPATLARAIKQLVRLRAIEVHRGLRVGVTRECSAYRVTLDDPKFLDLCNEVCRISREEIAQERNYRRELSAKRQEKSRPRLALNTTARGGAAPLHPPFPSPFQEREKPSTCEGLNLFSMIEVISNKTLQCAKRETDFDARRHLLRRQAAEIKTKYGAHP